MSRLMAVARWVLWATLLVACAPLARAPVDPVRVDREDAPLPAALRGVLSGPHPVDFLLLGEIHDRPLHHALRARWLEALAAQGRFVLALEQLDADRQDALDASRATIESSPVSSRDAHAAIDPGAARLGPAAAAAGHETASDDRARRLAQAAGFDFEGWHWPFYARYFEFALRRGLPLVAANLSNAQARHIARGGSHPLAGAQPADWTALDRDAMAAEIRDGHCGMLPERAIAPMVAAQVARDAQIARVLVNARRSTGLPVVLLAGNGHVRSDLGVPRHLARLSPGAKVLSVGLIDSEGPASAFDLAILTPTHAHPDHCATMRAPAR